MSNPEGYIPGACNIGAAEIRLRRRIGWIAFATTIFAGAILVVLQLPAAWRLALFFPATLSAAGFLQAAHRFCVKYGLLGQANFGAQTCNTYSIEQPQYRRQDRRTALKLAGLAALIGAAIAIAAYALPF